MCTNYPISHRLVAYFLVTSLFLQSCYNPANLIQPSIKDETSLKLRIDPSPNKLGQTEENVDKIPTITSSLDDGKRHQVSKSIAAMPGASTSQLTTPTLSTNNTPIKIKGGYELIKFNQLSSGKWEAEVLERPVAGMSRRLVLPVYLEPADFYGKSKHKKDNFYQSVKLLAREVYTYVAPSHKQKFYEGFCYV